MRLFLAGRNIFITITKGASTERGLHKRFITYFGDESTAYTGQNDPAASWRFSFDSGKRRSKFGKLCTNRRQMLDFHTLIQVRREHDENDTQTALPQEACYLRRA